MRTMMTWMMAAAFFVGVAALPGCETSDDSQHDGSGTKTQTTKDADREGSDDKNSSNKGSGYR